MLQDFIPKQRLLMVLIIFEEVITGTWDLSSSKDGYNQITESVTIEEDVLTEHNLQMTAPILEFSPECNFSNFRT